jgi:regulatory protein
MPLRRSEGEASEASDWSAAGVEAAAVRLLAGREHSRAELARKLDERGAPGELIDEVLASLAERGLQSDERYAEALVTSRIGRGQGPVRIGRELAERGVAAVVIEAALEAVEADWRQLARATRRKRFGAEPPSEWNERVRQSRFLEYRGFNSAQIRFALGGDLEH